MQECTEAWHFRSCQLPSLYTWYVHCQLTAGANTAGRLRQRDWRLSTPAGVAEFRLAAVHEGFHSSISSKGLSSAGWQLGGEQESGLYCSPEGGRARVHSPKTRASPARTASTAEDLTLEQAVLAGNGQQALHIFQEMKALDPAALPMPDVCDGLLQLLAKGMDFAACWKVYQTLKPAKLRYSTLSLLMYAAIKAYDVYRALETFRDMQARGLRPNVVTWSHLISSFNKARRKGLPYDVTAYKLWQEMRNQADELEPDASAFATGIMACSAVGRLDEARDLLEEMQALGFKPDIRVYNILLKGHARKQGTDTMQELFEEIQKAGLNPSSTTYNTLIDAYANAGLLQQARQMLMEADSRGLQLDVWAYSSLIKGYILCEQLPEALSVLDEMQAARIQPNVVTFTTLVDGCVRAGEMDKAEDLLVQMRKRRISANVITYNALLRGYAMRGNLEAVRDVLERMGEAGIHPREDTFNTLMEGALQTNDPELVPQLFRQLLSLDLRPDSLSYTALITALARLSRPDSALQAFGQMETENGLCATALNALIAALANADRMTEAEAQLQRAATLAEQQGFPPPIEAYGAVLKAYARQKDAASALDLLEEFQERGGEPDDRLVDMVATACVRAGQFMRALKFVRTMERAGKNVDKARIKQTLEVVLRSKELAYKKRSRSGIVPRNENLERLKFWLGLPNSYYGSDSDEKQPWNERQ